jgi:tetratricopeptide (TPR) repeat protein
MSTATAASLPTETAAALGRLGHLSLQEGRFDEAEDAYRRALELHDELGSRGRAVEAGAGRAAALQAIGRVEEARRLVEDVIGYFRLHGADGIDDPAAALLACRQVLETQRDAATAADLVALAREHIEETASRLSDPEVRRSYREKVAAHRDLLGDAT